MRGDISTLTRALSRRREREGICTCAPRVWLQALDLFTLSKHPEIRNS